MMQRIRRAILGVVRRGSKDPRKDSIMQLKPFVCLGIFALGFIGIALGDAALLSPKGVSLPEEPASGLLEISFFFNKVEGVVPSYQIAIWLEREAGEYVKTLFVSEWLAGSGLGLETVCPDWVKQAHWDKVAESEFDAATHPTPPVGATTLKFDCKKRGIAPGSYRFCVQAHITENYNILYRGRIVLGQKLSEAAGEVFYSPKKHPLAAESLYNVRARYVPEEESNSNIKRKMP